MGWNRACAVTLGFYAGLLIPRAAVQDFSPCSRRRAWGCLPSGTGWPFPQLAVYSHTCPPQSGRGWGQWGTVLALWLPRLECNPSALFFAESQKAGSGASQEPAAHPVGTRVPLGLISFLSWPP